MFQKEELSETCSHIKWVSDFYRILRTIRRTFFLWKIAFKIQVRLILKVNIKMSSVWFKIPTSLKNGHIFDATGTYLYLATLDSSGGSSAQMRRIWVAEIHKLANTVSLLPRHHKPEQCRAFLCHCSLQCRSTMPVNLNWKWFVLSVTVQYFC